MLGYELEDLNNMTYGVDNAILLINSDEHPAINAEKNRLLKIVQSTLQIA